jgi:chromosome segregation ATPase
VAGEGGDLGPHAGGVQRLRGFDGSLAPSTIQQLNSPVALDAAQPPGDLESRIEYLERCVPSIANSIQDLRGCNVVLAVRVQRLEQCAASEEREIQDLKQCTAANGEAIQQLGREIQDLKQCTAASKEAVQRLKREVQSLREEMAEMSKAMSDELRQMKIARGKGLS